MKKFKVIFLWFVICIVIQGCFYFYIDKLLIQKEHIVIKKIELPQSLESKYSNFSISIPKEAEHISNSYNGKYLSYILKHKLYVVNTENKKKICISSYENNTLDYYMWVSNGERIILSEKSTEGESSKFQLYYYDVYYGEKVKVKDIGTFSNKSTIENIQFSTITGILYFKISHIGHRSTVFRMDLSHNINEIKLKQFFIGNIVIPLRKDILVYEDIVSNKIFNLQFPYSTAEEINIPKQFKQVLLGRDEDNRIYIGELENEYVKSIYRTTYDNKMQWEHVELKVFVKKENIYIDSSGNIYIIDNKRGMLQEIKYINGQGSYRKFSYEGEFIGMFDRGFIYINKNKIKSYLYEKY